MGFKDKYTTDKITEPTKTLLDTNYYALCEMLDQLNQNLNRLISKI